MKENNYIGKEFTPNMKKRKELRYNKWKDHLANTRELTNYSVKRMDLLIITISGAGIYIIFETLREFKTGNISIDNPSFLLASGIFFLISIASNFISQITGFKANSFEECFTMNVLDEMEGDKIDKDEQDDLNCKIKTFNKATTILNNLSVGLMFVGLVLLSIFNYFLLS